MASDREDPSVAARSLISQIVLGHRQTELVGLAARLKLADAFGGEERSADDIAAACALPGGTTNRLLRALAAIGLLTEHSPGRFSLTAAGSLLRTDRPDSVHGFVRMFTDPVMTRAWGQLEGSIRTGSTAFDELFGTDFFGHLKTQPELSAIFNDSMSQHTRVVGPILAQHYDFGRFHTVADIGGGDATLLAAILGEHSRLKGILFDTAEGSAQAGATVQNARLADRVTIEVGDFFETAPAAADLYLLKSILHDWDDDRATTILGHCREVIPDDGRLVIIEPVLPEVVDPDGSPSVYLSDLNMLVNVGGLERTRSQFADLLERSGFALGQVPSLPAPVFFSLIEGVPA